MNNNSFRAIRCTTGGKLYQEWDKAMQTHEPEKIYHATQTYFHHKRGCNICRFEKVEVEK